MKKLLFQLGLLAMTVFVFSSCNNNDSGSSGDSSGSSAANTTSFDFTLSSYKKQEVTNTAGSNASSFTVDQIMRGQLTTTNTDTTADFKR